MGRAIGTILALAVIGGGAIYLAITYLKPKQEEAERRKDVLNPDAQPRLVECVVLEDNELPEGIKPPGVGDTRVYVSVTIFYPGLVTVADLDDHILDMLDGKPADRREPVAVDSEVEDDGIYAYLTYELDDVFETARLMRGEEILFNVVQLDE